MANTYVKTIEEGQIVKLLPRDIEVYNFIVWYLKHHGFSPTLNEIGAKLLTQRQTIIRNINRLVAGGFIVRGKNKHRSLIPVKDPVTLNQI